MNKATDLQQRLESGKGILLAEISPRAEAEPAGVQQLAKRFAGKVHALGVSDNRDRVGMAALAAATLVAGQGVEPILHVTTRDRNRIALVSEILGAPRWASATSSARAEPTRHSGAFGLPRTSTTST